MSALESPLYSSASTTMCCETCWANLLWSTMIIFSSTPPPRMPSIQWRRRNVSFIRIPPHIIGWEGVAMYSTRIKLLQFWTEPIYRLFLLPLHLGLHVYSTLLTSLLRGVPKHLAGNQAAKKATSCVHHSPWVPSYLQHHHPMPLCLIPLFSCLSVYAIAEFRFSHVFCGLHSP